MTFNLRCLLNKNLRSIPFFSENSLIKSKEYKNLIDKNIPDDIQDNELVIVCLQEVYGYRTGIFGWISNYFSNKFSSNTHFLQRFINYSFHTNIYGDDLLLFSSGISLLNRLIPLINLVHWDFKKAIFNYNYNKSILKYINKNYSFSNCLSLNPLFDCGCCILSNKIPRSSGFEKFEFYIDHEKHLFDKISNKGIIWSYFFENDKGILILTCNSSETDEYYNKFMEFDQILILQKKLESQFKKNCPNIDSFIIFDEKINKQIYYRYFDNIFDFKIIDNDNNMLTLYKCIEPKLSKIENIAIDNIEMFCTFFEDTKNNLESNSDDTKIIIEQKNIENENENIEKDDLVITENKKNNDNKDEIGIHKVESKIETKEFIINLNEICINPLLMNNYFKEPTKTPNPTPSPSNLSLSSSSSSEWNII